MATEVPAPALGKLLDTLATDYGGDVDALVKSAAKGQQVTAAASDPAPPAAATEPPAIEVEAQPWQKPSWPTAAAPASRAGAPIHIRTATSNALCGDTSPVIASVSDPTQVTCRACRLMVSAPHISPCSTERALRDAPHDTVADASSSGRSWTGWAIGAALAGLIILLGTIIWALASGGHSSTASTPSPAILTGGASIPTPTDTPAPTNTPAPSAAPTPAPTAESTPAPTAGPSVTQNVIVTQGQQQSQSQAQGATPTPIGAPGVACSPATSTPVTSITFVNSSSMQSIDLYWVDSSCHEILYAVIPPDHSVTQTTYVDHVWRLRSDATQVLLLQVVAKSSAQTVGP